VPRHRIIAPTLLVTALTGALAATSLAQAPTSTPLPVAPGAVTLVAYSTPREAYAQTIEAFGATEAGSGVQFETSFGASGDQSRAVAAGLRADYVGFSLSPDMDRLVDAGIVAPDWSANEYAGNVTDSIVVFAVRPGNPRNIQTWNDLIAEGVQVVTPNPILSGGARWNIMAAYGAKLLTEGKTEEEAVEYLRDLFSHVIAQDKSARDALQTFLTGQGDVLLAYENEAITARLAQQPLEYVVPASTILIENPAAVTLNGDAVGPAEAFRQFVLSPDGQLIFANLGYRPVVADVVPTNPEVSFPVPERLFTIADLGGWPDATARFFDKENGIVALIERDLGVDF
jgi:sulfate transport system substrate-binding protein